MRQCEPDEDQFGLECGQKKSKKKKTISEFHVEASPSYHPTLNSLQVDLMRILDIKEARDSDILMIRDRWHWNVNWAVGRTNLRGERKEFCYKVIW